MMMSEYDICTFIREAADPPERVKICAQMNLCKPDDIRAICTKHGVAVSKRADKGTPGRKRSWTGARIELLRNQLAMGKTQQEIACYFGLTSSATISRAIKLYIKKASDVKRNTEGTCPEKDTTTN